MNNIKEERMKKIVAMIPARMGSKRVSRKNIRLLNNKPLIQHVIDSTKEAGCFHEIYVNSESLTMKQIAESSGVKFFKRSQYMASDKATNDEFTLEFLENISCDIVVQILPTSPFITAEEIRRFVDKMISEQLNTLISVSNQQIECVYNGRPINFDPMKISPPSQEVIPVHPYACSLMGWSTENYVSNMDKYSAAYHGADGKKGFFELKGYSTVDIDNEEDFQLAEVIARHLSRTAIFKPQFYGDEHSEVNVPSILYKDGVKYNNLHDCNKEIININNIREMNDSSKSWSHRVVNTENNSATIIHQQPGEGNRRHYHPDWNEWWYIIAGEWNWEIDGVVKKIRKDDIVFIKKGVPHRIEATGTNPAIRIAVSREDVVHVYPDGDES
jgi:CMP-N-acetylneuraminic acid synthetase/quercetin dioxygenase-like cupin family protein